MNSTLTAARAALYFGANIKVSTNYITAILQMLAISENELLVGGEWTSYSDCKLLLRTVEQLTDEEVTEFRKIAMLPISWDNKRVISWIIDLSCLLEKNQADYLRSIGVDIDNAIADGWAVEQEEVSHE